jgi:replicative DNA helicase
MAFKIAETAVDEEEVKPGEFLQQAIDEMMDTEARSRNSIMTGFNDLDRITNGFQKGDMIIIASRPSVGKTAIALEIARNAATAGRAVGFFSMEMSRQQIGQRLISAHADVSQTQMMRNQLNSEDFRRLKEAIPIVSNLPILINDSQSCSINKVRARARRMVAKHKIELLVVDYIQLMTMPKRENRQTEVASISRGLKGLARELNLPVVCLSQLNRMSTMQGGKDIRRPRMSELRESGALEADADLVILLHREDLYKANNPDFNDYEETNIAELLIEKQRMGETGLVKLRWNGPTTSFSDLYEGEIPI